MLGKITKTRWVRHANESAHIFYNRKTLWQMLRDVWQGKYKMSLLTNMILVLGVLYVIIPIDFDWIPFIGWIDDLFVLLFIGKRLVKETQRYNRYKVMDRRRA